MLVEDQAKPRPAASTQTMSLSVEDLRTPTKPATEMHTKKTQTPESALKSHKRLEWDPAADVGYYKRALSTSNISTLERSVLEECGWRQPMQQQRSETDLDRLQRQESENKAGTPMQEKTTVPLASSTMVSRQVASAGASRKVDLHGSSRGEVSNSSSRGEPADSSSKGEVSKSSSKREATESSSRGEPANSSSKRETSHRSTKGEASKSSSKREDSYSSSRRGTTSQSSSKKETPSNSSSRKESLKDSSNVEALPMQVSSLISSRRESLASSALAASRVSSRAENSHSSSRMGSVMSSRRESQATSLYGSSAASSFDYHINMEEQEWLRSLQKPQQKGKRGEEQRDQASGEKEPSKADHRPEEDQRKSEHSDRDQKKAEQREKELRRAEQREKEREQERQFTAAQFERVLGSRRRENKENQVPPKENQSPATAGAAHKGDLDLGIDLLCSLVEARSLSQGQKKKLVRDIARRIACLDLTESSSGTATSSSRRERARAPLQWQDVATNTSVSGSRSSSLKEQPMASLPVPAPRKRNADGSPSPLPSSSFSATSSTSASNEVITQKTNIPTREAASTDATDVDAEPMSAIREALNPMTQSEIEYEERMKAGMDPERRSQLNWIEAEIERLQSLKFFLADIEANLPSTSELKTLGERLILAGPEEQQEQQEEPESSSAEGRRRRKAARRLAKAVQTEDLAELEEQPTPKPPVRIESVRVPPRIATEMQAPPPLPPPHRYPRTRMATPVLASHSSSSGGGGDGRSESVSSFVQQRHRRFREHYQNQQQQQLLLLKQQQLQRLQQQHKQQQQQLYQHKHQGEQHIVHEAHCRVRNLSLFTY